VKFIDLFAGIGGFRLGMEMAGHECVGHCEIDKFAQRSYKAMHEPKEGEWFADDIRRVSPEELPEADCYCAGFPCQSFSIAGKRGGFEDTRGTLFFEIMRLARLRKPKYLFLENVKGLLSHDGGRTFGTILSVMGECGYDAEYQVLNSKDFGVPQNRERVFIIGHLRGKSRPKVFPITGTNRKTLKQIIGGSQGCRVYNPEGLSCTLASEAGGMGAKTVLYFVDLTKGSPIITNNARCLKARYNAGITNRNGDNSGVAILTQDNIKIRRLTPRECFRLHGFPDEYFERARKVNSDNQLYIQAGNSVTVNVVYQIAKRLD
jgi:DNA (cytosine-5)-methyltransferase 1